MPLLGEDKYLGGELALNDCIYGIPGTGRRVLKIHIPTQTMSYIGPKLAGPFMEGWWIACALLLN